MQYQLLIDATGKYTNIYLIKNENIIIHNGKYLNEKNLSHELTKYIELCFNELKIKYNDLNKLFIVYGPGKFSAMRISAIFIKTIHYLFNAEIYIINKLNYIGDESKCVCIVESDGNKYFVATYENYDRHEELLLMNNFELEEYLNNKVDYIKYFDIDDKFIDVKNRLKRFRKADGNFLVNYHKSPC